MSLMKMILVTWMIRNRMAIEGEFLANPANYLFKTSINKID